ncbi:NTP transferase domain-containing protein [Mycolicibacterium smegmatis]|uniref:NTP transferase domain-containing protein n=1 Tax=Mycolicibacterium smegmatis TaxID=1772 RepID=UPI0005D8DA7C|nr:NTP transferase domain-containing protein [Mycolicibacterium smegmatis]MDF1899069.1 NTP transferase domain-containing protein [Mycolicibacterium smegmatis]MDF1904893.1 NTP transferase domain-containing protein [Mycolicibacterium smegmatis]MDF1918762.1 NTP transferase domain-containing protein [Mycolicibacterium smegmatis]MDF1924057.1 NTP transferase domain-containing protein [Mycolicibacterium smegmatis]UAK53343.1 NTP transferase domain-containing protein [Mycolicibacterium smegmatis]
MSVRHIIMAAGEGTRWGNHTGVPKHLISPLDDGEALLARLVRQLHERGENDVIVTGPQDYKDYLPDHVQVVTPDVLGDTDEWLGVTKFHNTVPHWSSTGRTILYWGDCWLDDCVVDAITRYEARRWLNWCRVNKSRVTGCPYGENFAVSFFPEHHSKYLEAMQITADAHRDGEITRSGGWEVLRAYAGARGPKIRTMNRNLPQVRDVGYMGTSFSDDFDKPEDFDRWQKNWKKRNA